MSCCKQRIFHQTSSLYSSEIQLVTTGGSLGNITAGNYQLIVHAPSWAPTVIDQAAAAIKEALQGQLGTAWTIAFGTYTSVSKPNGDSVSSSALDSQNVGTPALGDSHTDLVYPFTISAVSTTSSQYAQLETIAGIITAIAAVLVVFGILWIVIEIDKATGSSSSLVWILVAVGAVLLLSQPDVRKSKGIAAKKATGTKTEKTTT
jgi:hypothetical protein